MDMTNNMLQPQLSQLLKLRETSITYWLSLWDEASGSFRFTFHQPCTLMATAYCVLGLEFTGGLSHLSDSQKSAVIAFLMAGAQPDGTFCDPLFRVEDILSKEHTHSYFEEETTAMCQQALDALAAPAPPPRNWLSKWQSPDQLIHYFESLPWQNPWLDSNPVMFALGQICHDVERHRQSELLEFVDAALDWLDAHQSSTTGLWQGPYEVSVTNAMAATFHFTFFYGYRNRPLQYTEKIIDSCLSLQEPHGLFSGNEIGQTCLDYDALDLLAKASLATDYRYDDVRNAMARAYQALLELHNSSDGGFANCKEHLIDKRQGRKAKLLRKVGLAKFAPSYARMPIAKTYNVCWRLLSCDSAKSNAFSTWFRLLALSLSTQPYWLNTHLSDLFTFRRLPFLGYHNLQSVKSSESSTIVEAL